MSMLKVKEVVICRQYIITYQPTTATKHSRLHHLVWANTAKGWFHLNTKFTDPAQASRIAVAVTAKGKLNTDNWSTL